MAFRAGDHYIYLFNKYLDMGYSVEQAEQLAKKQTAAVNQRILRDEDERKRKESTSMANKAEK